MNPTAQKSDRAYDFRKGQVLLMQSSPSAGQHYGGKNGGKTPWRTAVRRGIIRIIHALETLYFVRSLQSPSTAGTGAELTPYLTCCNRRREKRRCCQYACYPCDRRPCVDLKLPPPSLRPTPVLMHCATLQRVLQLYQYTESFADLVCVEVIRTISQMVANCPSGRLQ